MRWQNVETPTFEGSAGSNGEPAVVETMQLVDRDGTEVLTVTKAVDGTKTLAVDEATVGGLAVPAIQTAVLTADFPKTNDTLAAVTGWSTTITLEAGKTYRVTGQCVTFSDTVGGFQIGFNGGTVTQTAANGGGSVWSLSNELYSAPLIDDITGSLLTSGVDGNFLINIDFTIQVDAGGTLILQFAQLVTDAVASVLRKYSTISAQEISPTPSY